MSQEHDVHIRGTYLVVTKSHFDNRFHIVAFDGQKLFDINLQDDYVNAIQPGKIYQFNVMHPTSMAAKTISVQGQPKPIKMPPFGMFCALGKLAYTAFNDMFKVSPEEPYLDVGTNIPPPKAYLCQGDCIKKQLMSDGKTRCLTKIDSREINLQYAGYGINAVHLDSFDGLPIEYDPDLAWRTYTLILLVAGPITGSWYGPRNYIIVAAIF
ncbi:Hypothetical predicted protein [Mytilus galloprovincialis]|uniref:Uncharacterized protein n=1 Tax=Mytilus galloprovincialis TaxID=29158 RepID=A0A8B6D602_MYTGA|nr:Hypothetical predicted protein [Mytilus galloprovincialis]